MSEQFKAFLIHFLIHFLIQVCVWFFFFGGGGGGEGGNKDGANRKKDPETGSLFNEG